MTNKPISRKSNIVVQDMQDEVLIYDLTINKAFCLNQTSGLVFALCDGARTVAEISVEMSKQLKDLVSEDLVYLALDELKKNNLLENSYELIDHLAGMSRREVVKKVGLAKDIIIFVLLMVLTGVMSTNAQTVSTVATGLVDGADVAFDSSGNMYVPNKMGNKIMKVDPSGVVSFFAGSLTSGPFGGSTGRQDFWGPSKVTVDSSGNVYVAQNTSLISKITPAGVVSTFKFAAAEPTAILAATTGDLYYFANQQLRKITPGGTDSVVAGIVGCSSVTNGTSACFVSPKGLAMDPEGNLYTLDTSVGVVRRIQSNGFVSEIGPRGAFCGGEDLAVDAGRNVYVADSCTSGRRIIKVNPAGVVNVVAGGATSGSADGVNSAATFNHPRGLAIYNRALYVADSQLSSTTGTIRKVFPIGTNFALASNGGVASASSTAANFSPSKVIDGDLKTVNWGTGGGWQDATTTLTAPDWIQVDFPVQRMIDQIDVFTVQENLTSSTEPTPTTTFSTQGIVTYSVQYWDYLGNKWVTVPNGAVTGNNRVWRTFTFPTVTTSKVRVYIAKVGASAQGRYSRMAEIQAWGVK